jgi:hypothetical protein
MLSTFFFINDPEFRWGGLSPIFMLVWLLIIGGIVFFVFKAATREKQPKVERVKRDGNKKDSK